MCKDHFSEPREKGMTGMSLSRGDFLKLGGAGIVGATVLGLTGMGSVLAQSASDLGAEFEAAAEEYGVPLDLLLAMGYVGTRWQTPPAETGEFEPGDIHGMGGYGVMSLSEDPQNDTLARAASLTGASGDSLRNSSAANIEGAAAVLSDLRGGASDSGDINDWYEAVSGYGGGDLYANQVFETLSEGASSGTSTGEGLSIAPRGDVEEREPLYSSRATPDYSGARWYGAYSGNYSRASRPSSNRIDKVIIHITEGSWSSAINWFNDSRAGVSAHYVVRSSDGFVGQCVQEKDIAYHAGNWPVNQTAVGIEHEGYGNNPNWLTENLYRSSARLTAYLCRKYNIPIDRSHILGHREVSSTACPGQYWNWTKYISLVKEYAGGGTGGSASAGGQVIDNATSGRFSGNTGWAVSTYSAQRYGSNYHYARPTSKHIPVRYKVNIPSAGKYKIYARWPADPGYNSRTAYRVFTSGGKQTKVVNQRKNGGKWVLLGTFSMSQGDRWSVEVSRRSNARGYVIADAIQVVKA